MASTSMPSAQSPQDVSALGRIFGALFSPKATFESVARRPTWLLPLLLLSLLALAVVGTLGQRVGWQRFFAQQLANSSQFQQLSPEQQQKALENQARIGPTLLYAGAVASPWITTVVIAALLLAVMNLLYGSEVQFKTSFGIVAHAWMPRVIASLLAILILFLKDPSTVDFQDLVASNAGAFLSSDAPKWQTSLLGSLDLFSFWTISLLAVGYRTASPKKISFGKAFAAILALWALYAAARAGITAAF